MDVVVKGMDMPRGCAACPLWARCYEVFAAQERFIDERPEWCPLSEGPSILADGTLEVRVSHEELEKVNRVMVSDDHHWCKIFYQDARGEWKTAMLDHEAFGVRPTFLYCSCCNRCVEYPTRFCPNCGARMDREE